MHEAFRLGNIVEKLPLKIECIECYGNSSVDESVYE